MKNIETWADYLCCFEIVMRAFEKNAERILLEKILVFRQHLCKHFRFRRLSFHRDNMNRFSIGLRRFDR